VVEACHTYKQRKEDSPNKDLAAAAADVSGLWLKLATPTSKEKKTAPT
jgi:hypothetical protein